MKTTQTLLLAATLSAGLLVATGANATLVSVLGGQAVNDTDLNVTWATNANLAATETFGLARNVDLGPPAGVPSYGASVIYDGGRMTWGGAMQWIAAMNTAKYLGFNDWRLPIWTDTGATGAQCNYNGTDCGYNVDTASSELAHLSYDELGNVVGPFDTAGTPREGWVGSVNAGPFTNLQITTFNGTLQIGSYWSGTTASWYGNAWNFDFLNGSQDYSNKTNRLFALAVRPGQVAAVPVPAAAWLLGSGLLGLIGVARRKAA